MITKTLSLTIAVAFLAAETPGTAGEVCAKLAVGDILMRGNGVVVLAHESQMEFVEMTFRPKLTGAEVGLIAFYMNGSGHLTGRSDHGSIGEFGADLVDYSIQNSKWNLAVIGHESVASGPLRTFWYKGVQHSVGTRRRNFVPITLEKVQQDSVPPAIRALFGIDLTGSSAMQEQRWEQLIRAISRH